LKTYRVHFTFYSEEHGNFDESIYSVTAENQFEARRTAWLLRDADDDTRFQSCVKQAGITWDASPLDLQDYFNAQAAYEKYMLNYIQNVAMQNAAIKQDEEGKKREEKQKAYCHGSMGAIAILARDIGKPFGMIPPTAYEEIEYAWLLVGKLDEAGQHDQAQALADRIGDAEKWDTGAIYTLRDLFVTGSNYLSGDWVFFHQHFSKDGVYPEKADINEREYTYIKRWDDARRVSSLSRLPMFGEGHIIRGSDTMSFDYRVMVLDPDALTPEYRTPENILWTPHYDTDGICLNLDRDDDGPPDSRFNVENMITGVVVALRHRDFIGVLRPEFAENIDFDTLKQEYAAQHTETRENDSDIFDNHEQDDDEWEQGDD